jgi:tetratricopeptide (TPR) repeat protein
MSDFDAHDGIDAQLEQIQDSAGALIEPCHYKSSFERYGELRRLARSEKRLVAYLNGVFFQMDQAQYLLDFQTMKERAIELVSLLESEERSRQLQADFEPHQYEYLVHSMSSCAYENLAEATGQSDGYNSDGMHACIADGLQVCRQTGKLACVSCFREYSVDVYTAADDTELAGYQCQAIIDHPGPWADRGDRRWLACIKSAWLELLAGKAFTARSLVDQAHDLIESDEVPLKREATIRVLFCDATLDLLNGDDISSHQEQLAEILPPAGECPAFELEMALLNSLQAVVSGDFAASVDILTPWDRKLSQAKALTWWFEVRLRLIATKRLAGDSDRLDRLVQPLEQAALQASDWLTERRLQRLLDDDFQPSPLALLAELRQPTTPSESSGPEVVESTAENGCEEKTEAELTPLRDALDAMHAEMVERHEEKNEEALGVLLDRILAYQPADVQHSGDAGRLIYYAGFLPLQNRAEEVWWWANVLATAHEDDARTISVLAALGLTIRDLENDAFADTFTSERLEQLYRKSLQLDGSIANNFSRAGDFYIQEANHGEAERCFARAFRLDRTSAPIALRLAEVYKMTDRHQDALNVLDLCLRNGCEESSVTWHASLVAFGTDRFESTLTYLDRFKEQAGEEEGGMLWANYYRAVSLYELGRFREALEAIEEEKRRLDMEVFHTAGIRACAQLALGRGEADEALDAFLEIPMREVDYLEPAGMEQTLIRVWKAAKKYLVSSKVCDELKRRLLGAGMMPDDYFEELRLQNSKTPGLDFFRCMLQQPLDERWETSSFSLNDQVDWPFYFAEWGVLARSEEEAHQRALKVQNECFPLTAEVIDVQASEESYEDHPGVVWQGVRFPGSFGDDDDEEGIGDIDEL